MDTKDRRDDESQIASEKQGAQVLWDEPEFAEFGRWLDEELAKLVARWEPCFPRRGKTPIFWRQDQRVRR